MIVIIQIPPRLTLDGPSTVDKSQSGIIKLLSLLEIVESRLVSDRDKVSKLWRNAGT